MSACQRKKQSLINRRVPSDLKNKRHYFILDESKRLWNKNAGLGAK